MSRILIITPEIKQELSSLRKYAEENPYSMDDLLDMFNKQKPVAGDEKERVRYIPVGFRVVFSIENQFNAKVKHLSVSVDDDKMLPSVPAIELIMEELGFEKELKDCFVNFETISETRKAISVIQATPSKW